MTRVPRFLAIIVSFFISFLLEWAFFCKNIFMPFRIADTFTETKE